MEVHEQAQNEVLGTERSARRGEYSSHKHANQYNCVGCFHCMYRIGWLSLIIGEGLPPPSRLAPVIHPELEGLLCLVLVDL
jgi:hypothetical protein